MYQAAYLTSIFALGCAASSFLAWGSGIPGAGKLFQLLMIFTLITIALGAALDEWIADRMAITTRIYWGALLFFAASIAVGQGVWFCKFI